MPTTPADCKCTQTHEWIRIQGDIATLGITKFAVNELTDVTYAQMKPVGTAVKAGDPVAEVESVKATSDVYAPIAGQIIEINTKLEGDPALVNSSPYADGWLVKIKVSDQAGLAAMMDAAAYDAKYPA